MSPEIVSERTDQIFLEGQNQKISAIVIILSLIKLLASLQQPSYLYMRDYTDASLTAQVRHQRF